MENAARHLGLNQVEFDRHRAGPPLGSSRVGWPSSSARWRDVRVSRHAQERARERFRWTPQALTRMTERALGQGLNVCPFDPGQTWPSPEFGSDHEPVYRRRGNVLYIFGRDTGEALTLLTLFHVK